MPYTSAGIQIPLMKDLLADVKTPEWYRLGLELTNDENEMRIISKDHGQRVQDALEATFNLWLKKTTDPTPSWQGMVDALRRIEENKLARNVEKMYC